IVYEGTVIKLGLWFNDVLYNNEYFRFDTANKGSDNFGTWLAFRSDATGTVTINSKRPEQEPDEPSGPVVDENIPTDLTNLGWYDFDPLANGTFPAIVGDLAGRGTYGGSLDGTLLDGDITFGAGTQFRYAGSDGWQGLIIEVTADDHLRINNSTFGTVYNELYPASTFGMDTLIGQKVNLKIALDIDDAGENYTFQVWINDIKAGDAFTLSKGGHIAGSMIGLYDNNSGNAITLSGAEEIVKETLPTDYTLLYPFDFGVQDGTYEMSGGLYDGHAGSIAGVNRIDKSILVFDEITFNGQVHMNFFGATNDLGWKLLADGDVLALTSGYGHVIANNGYSYIVLNDAIAGVDTVGGTYSLKISVIYEGDVATMGIWFNDVLYNDEYFVFDISAEKAGSDEFGAYLAFRSDTTGTVTIQTTSKEPDGPTPPPVITPSTPPQDLNKITFHSYGIADDVYAKNINGMYNGDIDGTIFSGYIKQSVLNHFRLGGTPDLNYGGGAGDWGGLIYRPNDATGGKTLVVEGSVAIPGWYIEVNASVFGMTTLYDSEYFLQQSIEFVDNDNDGEKDDLKLGIWINGVMIAPYALNDTGCAADGYIYKNDVACNVGNLMMLYVADFGDNSTITVRSDENVEVVLPEAPEKDPNIPTDLTVLDWADFAPLTNATYPAIAGNLAGKGIYDGSLDGTLLDGDIAFGAGTEIRYAGNDGWQGVRLGISADDQLYISNSTFGTLYGVFYKPAAFGLETLIDTTVNLKIALDIDDSGENYTFQVWINDIKAGDAFTLAKGDCGVGSVIGLYDLDSGNAITLSGADVPEPVVLPKPTDPSKLAVISLKSFGIADTKLEVAKPVSGVMMYPVSYDGTVFKATLDLTTDASVGGTYIRFGGPDGGWNGLGLQTGVNGLLHLIEWHNPVTASSVVATLDPTVAGVDFYDGPFDVQISFEYVVADHDGVKNDVLVGVYFNGKAYNEDGFVVKDFEMANTLLMYVTENKDADGNPIKTQPMNVTGVQDVAFLPFDFEQFGFTENFKDTFKFAESEKVHGVPLGVTLAPFTGEPIEACFWIVVMAAAVAFGVLLIVKQVAKKAKK
ncbi:MAG: hypothetical protein IJ465_02365, partial [Clostridia bacterium]|nr:hypothetical protein [Clostridia bacterium]